MGFEFRIEPKAGYMHVWQRGCPSAADLVAMQSQMEQVARSHGLRGVLFDNRELIHPGEELRELMIKWLDQTTIFVFQALVMHSELIAVRTSMDGLAKRVSRRGFRTIGQAEQWLARRL